MAGMLSYGFMAGVGDEAIKQSDEKRKNKFQEIRDKRLAEIQKEGRIHSSELATTENMRQEGVSAAGAEIEATALKSQQDLDRAAKSELPFNTADGTITSQLKNGTVNELVNNPKTFAPTAGSTALDKFNQQKFTRRGVGGKPGQATTYEELLEAYQVEAYEDVTTTNEFGEKIKTKRRIPGSRSLTDYINGNVIEADRLEPNNMEALGRDPVRWWAAAQTMPGFKHPGGREKAIEAIQLFHPWWNPEMEGGQDNPSIPSPNPNEFDPSSGLMPDLPTETKAGASTSKSEVAGMLKQGLGVAAEPGKEIQVVKDQIRELSKQSKSGELSKEARDVNRQKIRDLHEVLGDLEEREAQRIQKEENAKYNAAMPQQNLFGL